MSRPQPHRTATRTATRTVSRGAALAGAVTALVLAAAAPAAAHVTVNPDAATQGGYAKLTFRVPNETPDSDTTKVEITLPADAPVASVSVKPVGGWTATAEKARLATPLKAHDTEITEAVNKITWTAGPGAAVKPGQFQEFDVSMGPLPQVDTMVFKALQTYSDGTVVRWIDEPTTDGSEPEHPAPVLKLAAAGTTTAAAGAAPAAGGPAVTATRETSGGGDGGLGTGLGAAGLALGLAGLVTGLLAYRRAARPAPAAAVAEPATTPAATS